jgi:hypothetical protein
VKLRFLKDLKLKGIIQDPILTISDITTTTPPL